jgi:hypothetical protein
MSRILGTSTMQSCYLTRDAWADRLCWVEVKRERRLDPRHVREKADATRRVRAGASCRQTRLHLHHVFISLNSLSLRLSTPGAP